MTKERTFRERATRGFAWNYLYKLTEYGLMSLYTILVVRHFGPNISAPYAVFTALCTILSLLASFGVDGVLLRYVQRISANEHSEHGDFSDIERLSLHPFLKTLFAFRIFIVTIVSVVIFLSLVILPTIVPSFAGGLGSVRAFSPYIIIFLFAQGVTAFCTFSLIGLLETKRVFYASLLSRGLLLAGGLFLIFDGSLSLQIAAVLYVGSAVINALYLFLIFRGEISRSSGRAHSGRFGVSSLLSDVRQLLLRPRHIKLFLATPLMLYGITTWGSDILSGVLGRQPDILMMRVMLGEHSSEIGYYLSASLLLLITEYVFLFGLGGTLVSVFSKVAHDDETEYHRKEYPLLARARKEIAGFQNVLLLPLCAYMMVFTPDIMRSIYGGKYDAAIPMLRIGLIALALTVGIFAGGMQATTLVAIGKERLVFRNRLCWGIANIIMNFFLIQWYGGVGAIIGTQFSNGCTCVTEYFFARKFVGGSFDLFGTLRIAGVSIISVTGCYYLMRMIGTEGSYISNSVISVLVTGLTVAGCYGLLKIPEAKKVWHRMQGLFRRSNSTAFANE